MSCCANVAILGARFVVALPDMIVLPNFPGLAIITACRSRGKSTSCARQTRTEKKECCRSHSVVIECQEEFKRKERSTKKEHRTRKALGRRGRHDLSQERVVQARQGYSKSGKGNITRQSNSSGRHFSPRVGDTSGCVNAANSTPTSRTSSGVV